MILGSCRPCAQSPRPRSFGVVVFVPVLLLVVSFVGCSSSTAKTVPTATPSATNTVQAPTPTLPTFSTPAGWSLVLQLGAQPDGSITSGGTFVSSNTYAVLIACEGDGHVTVDYAPQGSATFVCSASPQSYGNQIGNPGSPPARQTITVNVAADEGVVWRGAIEVER
jgi:hypothetical protein